jgi:hypothetical protein
MEYWLDGGLEALDPGEFKVSVISFQCTVSEKKERLPQTRRPEIRGESVALPDAPKDG